MFVPCHPATRAIGHVTDMNGKPIQDATVTLYGRKTVSNTDGCFAFNMADAFPFEFSTSAAGFNSITVPSKAGFFIISVKLAPVGSSEIGEVKWKEINSHEYKNAKPCT